MPELPEVETIRRQLLPLYRGERFKNITFNTAVLLRNCSAEEFERSLRGKKIDNLSRRGKYLIFECEGIYPVFHLGMSGHFLENKAGSLYPQHIHLELGFQSGKQLFFQDVRKFGKIWLYRESPKIPNLGADPLNGELTLDKFTFLLQSKKMNIKQFFMNQAYIAGIGNIYASEILFKALISPYRKTNELTPGESAKLFRSVNFVLHSAIEKFGTTYSSYRTVTGETGENQHFLKVYQRANQPCVQCGEKIKKIVLGSRSTFFCEKCQC